MPIKFGKGVKPRIDKLLSRLDKRPPRSKVTLQVFKEFKSHDTGMNITTDSEKSSQNRS